VYCLPGSELGLLTGWMGGGVPIFMDRLFQPELVYQVEAGLHAQLLDQQVTGVLHLQGNIILNLVHLLSFITNFHLFSECERYLHSGVAIFGRPKNIYII
jgi:hypothetical protein